MIPKYTTFLDIRPFFICKNHEIPWKNTLFHEKPIYSANLFSIFKIYIFLESRDVALQTNEEFFSKTYSRGFYRNKKFEDFYAKYKNSNIKWDRVKLILNQKNEINIKFKSDFTPILICAHLIYARKTLTIVVLI